jgi:flagellar hook-associated protein FlgK
MKSSRRANATQRQQAKSQYDELKQLQDHLDDLQTDRASMEIVFTSLKNAFLIDPSAEEEEIDKEICRAYDDLMAQVRQLDRSLKRLDKSIKQTEQKATMSNQQTTSNQPTTP